MEKKRFIMNAGRTTRQGQQINVGKDHVEYQAIVNTLTMHPGDMKAVGMQPPDSTLLPRGNGWLLVEFGGASKEDSDGKARLLVEALSGSAVDAKLYSDAKESEQVWRVRESALGATAHIPGKPLTWEGWEDSAVPPAKLGAYLRDLRWAQLARVRAPSLADLPIVRHVVADVDVGGDGHPYVGLVQPGLWMAAGFAGHGAMHGPPVAELLARIIAGRPDPSVDITSLDPWRRPVPAAEWMVATKKS